MFGAVEHTRGNHCEAVVGGSDAGGLNLSVFSGQGWAAINDVTCDTSRPRTWLMKVLFPEEWFPRRNTKGMGTSVSPSLDSG